MAIYAIDMERKYHHGDLRRELLIAAEAELDAHGIEGFSLRKVAQRAQVSHAAPAHHYKNADGLLTALAAEGYVRLVSIQEDFESDAQNDASENLIAQGMGYIAFAIRHTALFRLMFSSTRPDFADADLADRSQAAFNKLVEAIAAVSGRHPYKDPNAMADANTFWSIAHGFADLISSGRMGYVSALPQAARDRAIKEMLSNAVTTMLGQGAVPAGNDHAPPDLVRS